MKTMMYTLQWMAVCCSLLFSSITHAQHQAKSFTASNGTFVGFYEFRPAGYDKEPSQQFPLIIFLHGIGERGNGTTELPYLLGQGIPRLIKQGATLTFTNPVTKARESFIVLSPQLPKSKGYWDNVYVDELLKYAKSNLKVDTNRIYLTGLSLGGGGTWAYPNTSIEHAKRFAAIAPICGVCYYNYSTLCATLGAAKLPVWGFTNADDKVVSPHCTTQACDALNVCNPGKIKKTVYPSGGHDSWTKAYDTGHNIQKDINLYEWFLSNTKKGTTPLPNQSPVASAGNPITVTLPVNFTTLNGSASKDPDGTISSYKWTKESGPATFTLVSPDAVSTSVTNLEEGTYVFKLTVTDNRGAIASSTVTVKVNAAPANQVPVAKVASILPITLPVNAVTLDGSGSSDPDGKIIAYEWTKLSGPAGCAIASPASAATVVNSLAAGSYEFQLTVTDDNNAKTSATVQVKVYAAPSPVNQPPVAKAGDDFTIAKDNVILNGWASYDPEGGRLLYKWSKISGPAQYSMLYANASTPQLSALVNGTYAFTLEVTDSAGATGADTLNFTVKLPVNQAPVADAGKPITITLPVNVVSLSGNGSIDPDGSITRYQWTVVSGPASFIIVNPNAANTSISNLLEGIYVFQLEVTDDKGATGTARVEVIVKAAPPGNHPPVANAGSDMNITLPVNSVVLNGGASKDSDGSIIKYMWTKVSGPASFTIESPGTAGTTVSDLTEGVYVFQLTVTDNNNATASASLKVTVYPKSNTSPVAKAGNDKMMPFPAGVVQLDGSQSYDPDGQITSYNWIVKSGTRGVTIVNSTTATPSVQGLVLGDYIIQLTVKDNTGSVASDEMKITIYPGNQRPKANAGKDISLVLPATAAVLDGSLSKDDDGQIHQYAWKQVSGPTAAVIRNMNTAVTEVDKLNEGEYQFELTVTDDNGYWSADTVFVSVVNHFTISQYLVVYPNPVVDMLNIRYIFDKKGSLAVRIFTAQGSVVRNLQFTKQDALIDLSINIAELSPGPYFLELRFADGKTAIRQFLKR